MECVIKVIEGPDAGSEAPLPPGQTLIGRSPHAALRLTSPEVSYEHLVITRCGDEYQAENLSARGTWIDGSRITQPVKLRPRELIRLSPDTVLRLEVAGGEGLLSRWRTLLLTLGVLLLLAVAALLLTGSSGGRAQDDWDRAYAAIAPWVQNQCRSRRLPPEMAVLLDEAWRLEQVGGYAQSQKLWLRLQLLVDSVEDRRGLKQIASDPANRLALQRLLTPRPEDPDPSDEELAAAMVQFINRRLTFAVRQARN